MLPMQSSLVDWASDAQVVIGLITVLFGALSGAVVWLEKRQVKLANSAVTKATGRTDILAHKVGELEDELGKVSEDVRDVRTEVRSLDGRVHGIEKSMETVARQADVAKINKELASLNGTVTAELRALFGMMHSFRESALRSGNKGSD